MTRRSTALLIYWTIAAAAVIFLTLWAARVSQGAISDCIDATCRIRASEGSTGSGCVFEIARGYVYVLTAAHVVGRDSRVQCEFWRFGHQSQPLAGEVIARSKATDAAIVALPEASFEGVLPSAIPLAPPEYTVAKGTTLSSVGCAQGGWSTGWKGHAVGRRGQDLVFLPPPANGRSGSAVFDAEGTVIVAIIRARAADDSEGIATLASALCAALHGKKDSGFRVQDSVSNKPASGFWRPMTNAEMKFLNPEPRTLNPRLVQCPGPGCPAGPDGGYAPSSPGIIDNLLPYRKRQDDLNRRQDGRIGNMERAWPTLPQQTPAAPVPSSPPVDLSPTNEKLDKISTLLTQFIEKQEKREETAKLAPPPSDEAAKKVAEEAAKEIKTVAQENKEHNSKVAALLEKVLGDQNSLSQRIEDRLAKVKSELGEGASKADIAKAYVKDFVDEKITDGTLGFSGGKLAAGALGLSAPLAFGIGAGLWLISRRIGTKIQNDEPLLVQRLFDRINDRFDNLRDKLHPSPAATAAASPTPQVVVAPVAVPAAGVTSTAKAS